MSTCPLCGGDAQRRRWGHSFSITVICRAGCGEYRTTLRVLTELMARGQDLCDEVRAQVRDKVSEDISARMTTEVRFSLEGRIVVSSSALIPGTR